jgi:hypothetical protein
MIFFAHHSDQKIVKVDIAPIQPECLRDSHSRIEEQ